MLITSNQNLSQSYTDKKTNNSLSFKAGFEATEQAKKLLKEDLLDTYNKRCLDSKSFDFDQYYNTFKELFEKTTKDIKGVVSLYVEEGGKSPRIKFTTPSGEVFSKSSNLKPSYLRGSNLIHYREQDNIDKPDIGSVLAILGEMEYYNTGMKKSTQKGFYKHFMQQ